MPNVASAYQAGKGSPLDVDRAFYQRIAQEQGITGSGYRILANHGEAAHQDVPHFHLHLVGGRDLGPMLRRPR